MPRDVIERVETPNGAIGLVRDPHDGSGKDRWFVEAWTQLKFDRELEARLRFESLKGPAPETTSRDRMHVDVGQVDVSPYRCELRLRARGAGGETWTLIIKPNWTEAQLLLQGSVFQSERPVALSSYTSIVAYMMMRAICRGIDMSDLTETATTVTIDMGEIPPLPPKRSGAPF